MSLFSAVGRIFGIIGKLVAKATSSAVVRGLTDAVVKTALEYVREAAAREFTDNAARRAYVVKMLVARLRIPESIASLAVELAVQLYKSEQAAG